MAIRDITSRQAVMDAIAECDSLGREGFLKKHGFGKALGYVLVVNGREYDSKAILGVAHGYQFPAHGPLTYRDFNGGKATVQRQLETLGFEVRNTPKL